LRTVHPSAEYGLRPIPPHALHMPYGDAGL
jgi:hypothetical protein